jgi:hypothetical protein
LSLSKALRRYISLPIASDQSAQLVPGLGGDSVPVVVLPHYWGSGMRYFPPEVGVASLVRGVVCRYESDLRVVLMRGWYVGEFFDKEPLPVAPS